MSRFLHCCRLTIIGLLVLSPFLSLLTLICLWGTGFPVFDDWIVYIRSFSYMLAGDYSVVFASVCEHRAVWSRLLHFFQYYCVGNTKFLLYLSQVIQLLSLVVIIRNGVIGLVQNERDLRRGFYFVLAFLVSLMLFSPMQAWIISRSAYIEVYICALGSLLVISAITRMSYILGLLGLLVAYFSTPGWMALGVLFGVLLFLSSFLSIIPGRNKEFRRFCFAFFILIIILALLYKVDFYHPDNHNACAHPGFVGMLRFIFFDFVKFTYVVLGVVGFPLLLYPSGLFGLFQLSGSALVNYSVVPGFFYVVVLIVLLVRAVRAGVVLTFANIVMVYSLIIASVLAVSRFPVLGDLAVLNYAYIGYFMFGWAVLLPSFFVLVYNYLSKAFGVTVSSVLSASIVLCLVFPSYYHGYGMLRGAFSGQHYLMTLFRDAFISPGSGDEKERVSRVLFDAYPQEVVSSAEMLKMHGLIPRNWLKTMCDPSLLYSANFKKESGHFLISIDDINGMGFDPSFSIYRVKDDFTIKGWAIDQVANEPLSAIIFDIGSVSLCANYGIERQDVVSVFKSSTLQNVGFELSTRLHQLPAGEYEVRVHGILKDGKTVRQMLMPFKLLR